VTVKFFAGDSRSRSSTPSHRRTRTPVTLDSELQAISKVLPDVRTSFKHISSWRPKKYLVSKLLSNIDNVYSGLEKPSPGEFNFASSIIRYYQDKLGLRPLVEHSVLDLVSNAIAQRTRSMEADTLLRFIEGFYGSRELELFFYARRMVSGLSSMTLDDCERLCGKIFPTDHGLVSAVVSTIKAELGKRHIASVQSEYFVYMTLWVFHHRDRMSAKSTPVTSPSSSPTIAEYVDSILMLKHETNKQRSKAPENILRESVQMEEVVNRMLADCCKDVVGTTFEPETLVLADRLMQCVMTGDEVEWMESGGERKEYSVCLEKRDELLDTIQRGNGEEELESSLFKFCSAIAHTRVLQLAGIHRFRI
jgi:hypothetical protein